MPAYNEEATIERVVFEHREVLSSVRDLIDDWEIVCLDDASTDRTLQVLQSLAARDNKIRVIRHPRNKGIYESFGDLFRDAKGTHIYMTASDGQWPAANIRRMLDPVLSSRSDLVVGVRANRGEVYGVWRYIVSSVFNLLPRIFFGVDTEDAGSVKLGKREIFNFELVSRSPFAEAERIIRARRENCRVDFVSITFTPRTSGKMSGAKWKNLTASGRDFLRCILKYGVFKR